MTWPIPALVVLSLVVVIGITVWIDDGIRRWKRHHHPYCKHCGRYHKNANTLGLMPGCTLHVIGRTRKDKWS